MVKCRKCHKWTGYIGGGLISSDCLCFDCRGGPEKEIATSNSNENQTTIKFDIEFVNKIEFHQDLLRIGYFPSASFRIDGTRILNCQTKELEKLNGKIVSIEIKEKI